MSNDGAVTGRGGTAPACLSYDIVATASWPLGRPPRCSIAADCCWAPPRWRREGIALRDGKVPSPDAPLLAQFPQYADIGDREQRSRWTIAHALTMTPGIEWNEDLSYDDPRNGQTAMEAAADHYRYVLERP